MMTNNNNALPFDVMGGRIITRNPTVSTLHKAHNINVLLPTLLFKRYNGVGCSARAYIIQINMFIEKFHNYNSSISAAKSLTVV